VKVAPGLTLILSNAGVPLDGGDSAADGKLSGEYGFLAGIVSVNGGLGDYGFSNSAYSLQSILHLPGFFGMTFLFFNSYKGRRKTFLCGNFCNLFRNGRIHFLLTWRKLSEKDGLVSLCLYIYVNDAKMLAEIFAGNVKGLRQTTWRDQRPLSIIWNAFDERKEIRIPAGGYFLPL